MRTDVHPRVPIWEFPDIDPLLNTICKRVSEHVGKQALRLRVGFLVAAAHAGRPLGREEAATTVFPAAVALLFPADGATETVEHAGDEQERD